MACAGYEGYFAATRRLAEVLWEFARDSTPDRLKSRFGDAEYDWDHRVNTTSGAVGWRDRLLGQFHSAYQPTEPVAFHEMLDALQHATGAGLSVPNFLPNLILEFRDYTFIDLGSGKGRTLLMASDYPFRRIVGVELLPSLHQIAEDNLRLYKSDSQECFALESICADASEFAFPDDPLVLYLFNPLPESGMRKVVANLDRSLLGHPRAVFVLYHNPLLEYVLAESGALRKIGATEQCSIFANRDCLSP